MKKLNKKQKEKVKEVLFKGLHVISYILSVLFILFLVIFGVQSCHQPKSVSAESYEPTIQNYVINNKYENAVTSYYDELFEPLWDICYPNQQRLTGDIGDTKYKSYNLNYSIFLNNVEYSCKGYIIKWEAYALTYQSVNYGYYYCYGIEIIDEDDVYHSIYYFDDTWYDTDGGSVSTFHCAYNNASFVFRLPSGNGVSYAPLLEFLSPCDETSFIFNKAFNYNAPMGTSLSTPYYIRPSNIQGGGVSYYLRYDVGLFISNGELYDYIRWEWSPSLGAVYYDFGDGNIKKGPDGTEQGNYVYLMYGNSHTNTLKIVNTRDQVAFMPSSSSYGYYYSNSATWVVDDYRYITFLEPLSDTLKTSIDSFNNNNQNAYTGSMVSGDINNIFTLIASAFSSWVPILSVYLLPGISIGTLVFIPLVALLVFAIIRIIKK